MKLFLVIVDDYSRYIWVLLLQKKKNQMHLSKLKNCSRKFRLSKIAPSRESVVIMGEDLRILALKNFAIFMVFNRNFLLLSLLNRMV
jgi:hypothetical protein